MKKILALLFAPLLAFAQTSVQKVGGGNNTLSNGSIVVGSGTSITTSGTGSISGNIVASSIPWAGLTAIPSPTLSVTGDGTAAFTLLAGGGATGALTLANVATGATTGSSTAIPVITFNNKGLVTAVSTAAVIAPAGTLTGATLAANVLASSLTSVGTISAGTWQGTALTGQYGGNGVANTGTTFTRAGNVIFSGAFASTFTFTGITGVTFPTSGTLATVAGTVSSITGTANQIVASASTGAVTLSLATTLASINSITAQSATNLVLNGGSSGVAATLGQGTNANFSVAPSGTGYIRFVPANETVAQNFFVFDDSASGFASFNYNYDPSFVNSPSGRRDRTWSWGYNVGPSGTRPVSGEPSSGWVLESDFEVSPGVHQFEQYWQMMDLSNNAFRPFSVAVVKANPITNVNVAIAGSSINFLSANGVTNWFNIGSTAVTTSLPVYSTTGTQVRLFNGDSGNGLRILSTGQPVFDQLTTNGVVTTSGGAGALNITTTTGSGSVVLAGGPTFTGGAVFAGAISGLTTISMSGQLTSTVSTGTAPFVVASTTNVANLNAATLNGATFAAPGAIGGTTASTALFTTIGASGLISANGGLTVTATSPGTDAFRITTGTGFFDFEPANTQLVIQGNNNNAITISTAGIVGIAQSTASSSISTGALVVSGGVGIAGAAYIGDVANVASTTEASGSSTGSFVTAGGVNVAKSLIVRSATASSSTTTGSGIFSGGVGIAGAIYIGTTLNVAGIAANFTGITNGMTLTTTGSTQISLVQSGSGTDGTAQISNNGGVLNVISSDYTGKTTNYRADLHSFYNRATGAHFVDISGATTAATVFQVFGTTDATTTASSGSLTTGGGLNVTKTAIAKHFGGQGTAPTGAVGTGAGTSPGSVTFDASANDAGGVVSVTTGTLPVATGTVFTVTFNGAYATAPHIVIAPANAATALLSGATMVVPSATTTTFVITAGATGLVAATAYSWFYHIVQ